MNNQVDGDGMNLLKSFIFTSMLATAPAAWSTTLYYSFDSPTGKLSTSQQYFSDGVLITAYGFDSGKPDDLYGTSSGLGVSGTDREIESNSFVQLNLTNLYALNPTSVQMEIASSQQNESYAIFGSNTLGKLGTEIQSGNLDAPSAFTLVSSAAHYQYIGVEAETSCGDILLEAVSANVSGVPEPGSFALLGAGLIGMAAFVSKLRK
jgi:hypothetical protein